MRRCGGDDNRRFYELCTRKHHSKPTRCGSGGTGDPLNNPSRVAPRHVFDFGVGVDNVLHTDRNKLRLRFSVINLTDKVALYNFLSTFSGTHFVAPRTYQLQAGWTF